MEQKQSKIVIFGIVFFSLFAIGVLINVNNLRLTIFAIVVALISYITIRVSQNSKIINTGIIIFSSIAAGALVWSEDPVFSLVYYGTVFIVYVLFRYRNIIFMSPKGPKIGEPIYLKDQKKRFPFIRVISIGYFFLLVFFLLGSHFSIISRIKNIFVIIKDFNF